MKTINKLLLALFVAVVVSCSKDDDENVQPALPVTMEFPADHSFSELAEGQQIRISFNRPAPVAGTITVEVNPADAAGFTTTPAVVNGEIKLPVAKGATGAAFTFDPVDDDLLHGNRIINFILVEDSDDFFAGEKDQLEITIFENEVAAAANFAWLNFEMMENETAEVKVPVVFSVPVPGAATLKVKVEGEAIGDLLATVPPMDANNIIELDVASGVREATIGLQPKNNAILNQHHNLKFRLIEVTGPVTMGDRLELALLLKDDELAGKLKSVETVNGSSSELKTLEYDSEGRISKIITKNNAAGYGVVQNYHYDEEGRLNSISGTTGDYESFTWENGKIVKSEKVVGFMGMNQRFFEYTDGKLSKRRDFDLDGNRNATETDRYTYTWHNNGNLKTLVHTSLVNGAWEEISTRTYENYSEAVHPFPQEAAPLLPLQQHLNLSVHIEQNKQTRMLYYAHVFDADGKLTERHDGFEDVKYAYY